MRAPPARRTPRRPARAILRALIDLLVEEGPATISIPQVAAARRRVGADRVPLLPDEGGAVRRPHGGDAVDWSPTPDGERPRQPAHAGRAGGGACRPSTATSRRTAAVPSPVGVGDGRARRRSPADPSASGGWTLRSASLRDRLDDDEYRRLRGIVGLIVSFDAYDSLTDVWGLSARRGRRRRGVGRLRLCATEPGGSGVGRVSDAPTDVLGEAGTRCLDVRRRPQRRPGDAARAGRVPDGHGRRVPAFTGRYGLPISHIEVRYVNGYPTARCASPGCPPSDRPPPPAWLLRVLTRVHPGCGGATARPALRSPGAALARRPPAVVR